MYYLSRKIKRCVTAFGIFYLILIVASLGMITSSINYFDINTVQFAYGQGTTEMSSNSNTNKTNTYLIDVQNLPERNVHVADIDSIVKLLADMVRDKLNDAVTILEITGKEPSVQEVHFAENISTAHMGIPGNLDSAKRKIAQEILSKNKDFGSVYFTLPNGDIYIGEPYLDQKQLPRLNYADRDWYKGVTLTNNTYISSVFMSASIHVPVTAIAVPVYATEENNNTYNNISPVNLSGYWVGIVDLNSIQGSIKSLNLGNNDRIVIVDHNGTAILDSYNISKNDQKLKSFAHLDSIKSALNGNAGSNIETFNGTNFFVSYQSVKVLSSTWAILFMQPYGNINSTPYHG